MNRGQRGQRSTQKCRDVGGHTRPSFSSSSSSSSSSSPSQSSQSLGSRTTRASTPTEQLVTPTPKSQPEQHPSHTAGHLIVYARNDKETVRVLVETLDGLKLAEYVVDPSIPTCVTITSQDGSSKASQVSAETRTDQQLNVVQQSSESVVKGKESGNESLIEKMNALEKELGDTKNTLQRTEKECAEVCDKNKDLRIGIQNPTVTLADFLRGRTFLEDELKKWEDKYMPDANIEMEGELVDGLEAFFSMIKADYSIYQQQITSLENENRTLTEQAQEQARLRQENDDLRTQLRDEAAAAREQAQGLARLRQEVDQEQARLRQENDDLRTQLRDEAAAAREQAQGLARLRQEVDQEQARLRQENDDLRTQLRDEAAAAREQAQGLARLRQEVDQEQARLRQENDDLRTQLRDETAAAREQAQELARLRQENDDLRTQLRGEAAAREQGNHAFRLERRGCQRHIESKATGGQWQQMDSEQIDDPLVRSFFSI
ncbi:conserved hypothetical protein [Talaromyces stipitatus ATCC 10500]|uniref:Uncharacterized protein n=1 Tax=Talaromyces stipitatus (strain ATCC 10500 / CBS 375.48 / QM 6759 / NRRL 1006) TaxID=441959 RepID=B8MSZ6_TALSN|nr:uncharacterized protein TSTA_002190 [Talaromyces stipitatus ATCC 10500]EED12152.1 conserved hypothetical protein [Talaromyces stipitatus ATCC 10500]